MIVTRAEASHAGTVLPSATKHQHLSSTRRVDSGVAIPRWVAALQDWGVLVAPSSHREQVADLRLATWLSAHCVQFVPFVEYFPSGQVLQKVPLS